MNIIIAGHPIYGVKDFSKSLAKRFGTNYIEVDEKDLGKNVGIFKNPPTKSGVYSGLVLAHKFENIDAVKVYIRHSEEDLIEYFMTINDISFEDAKDAIVSWYDEKSDDYKRFFGVDIKDLNIYDLVISASKLDNDGIISIIERYVNKIKK